MDTTNKFMVAGAAERLLILKAQWLAQPITKADALNLAAWLVALADDDGAFPALLEAVQNT
jgi:hypothetical protein